MSPRRGGVILLFWANTGPGCILLIDCLMIDKDCFGEEPIMAEILDLNTPFIDIGIPSSLHEAQDFIPEIIKGFKINK